MGETIIRPSTRLVRLGYFLVFGSIGLVMFLLSSHPEWGSTALLLPAVLLVFPVYRHIQLQFTRLILTEDGHLRYESGFLSKSERSVDMAKVQDVAVTQSFGQRIYGLGDIAIETAGGSSKLEMKNVDNPRGVRDQILAAAKRNTPHS